jgi:hypothetical protein
VLACQVSACLCVRVSPKTTACQMSVCVRACVSVFVSIMLRYSFPHAHTHARTRRARAHTHRSSVGAHDWHSYCGVRTHSDSHGAGRTHAARGMYMFTYVCTQIRYASCTLRESYVGINVCMCLFSSHSSCQTTLSLCVYVCVRNHACVFVCVLFVCMICVCARAFVFRHAYE